MLGYLYTHLPLLDYEIPDVGIFYMLIYLYWVLKYLMSGYLAHLSLLGFEIPDVGYMLIYRYLVLKYLLLGYLYTH